MLGDVEVVGDLADGSERIRTPCPNACSSVAWLKLSSNSVFVAAVSGAVAVDPLLQNGRRLLNTITRRKENSVTSVPVFWVTATTLAFLAQP